MTDQLHQPIMTTPHRATPEQWADLGAFASDTRACILELRARIEALEAAQNAPTTAEDRPEPQGPSKHELFGLLMRAGGATQCVSVKWLEPFADAILARWGRPALALEDATFANPPAENNHD